MCDAGIYIHQAKPFKAADHPADFPPLMMATPVSLLNRQLHGISIFNIHGTQLVTVFQYGNASVV